MPQERLQYLFQQYLKKQRTDSLQHVQDSLMMLNNRKNNDGEIYKM